MIIYRKGNVVDALLNGEVSVLIHQTNCQGVMGSGIAREIKERIPEAYEAYKRMQKDYGGLRLGNVSYAFIKTKDKKKDGWVFNVNGQDQYIDRLKCNTNYAQLAKGLLDVAIRIDEDDIIAMPKIGAGLGGGDWKVIEAIINSVFTDRDVFVYELE